MIDRGSKVRKTKVFIQTGGLSFLTAIIFQILALIGNIPYGIAESGRMDRIDGYGGYKFGMTLQEADAVRSDDVVNMGCEFNEIETCIERKTNLFGEDGIIIAQISSKTHTVTQVIVSFNRIKSVAPHACKNVLSSISGPLLETFGPKFKEDGVKIIWHLSRGGKIQLTKLCITDDTGVVVVSYEPSDAFQ